MLDFLIKYSQWIIYFGAITSATGAILAGIKSERDSAIHEKLTRKSQEQVDNINNEITGGNSFPFLNIDIYNEGKEIKFKLYNYGTTKLNNVTMDIIDGAKMGNNVDLTSIIDYDTEEEKYTTTKYFDILYPNKSLPIKDFKIDGRLKDICITVHFNLGNRHLIESIIFYDYKNSDLRRGEVKIFDGNNVLLHYSIDKEFKRNYIKGFNF